jgi:serine/threonine protein kinase
MALAAGLRLGPYEIIPPAGAGGMGEVYRAHDSRLIFAGLQLGGSPGLFVAPDSKRWLVAFYVEEPNASPLILTTNWSAALKQ